MDWNMEVEMNCNHCQMRVDKGKTMIEMYYDSRWNENIE